MLHLRVIVPSDRTDEVYQVLASSEAVTNIVVVPGAARAPAGDLIMADVAREETSTVIKTLSDLGIEQRGSVTIEQIDASLSAAARRAEQRSPGKSADAVVWEEVESRTSDDSTLSVTFLSFLVLATLIAVIGIVTDQPILIVGAMVVGPEFSPLAGVCVSLVQRHRAGVAKSLLALAVGFPTAIAVAALLTWLGVDLGLITRAMFEAPRPLTAFIAHPDVFSPIVAFIAGIAGMLSLTSAKSGALIGVFISVTTIPAAGNMAVALVFADLPQLYGSLVQLVVNLAAIVLAGTLTLLAQKLLWSRYGPPRPRPRPRLPAR